MSLTIRSGGLLVMDPSDKKVIDFDWGDAVEGLPAGVQIDTNVFTISPLRQANVLFSLTKDSESIVTGLRSVRLRLLATTALVGDKYAVASKIVTLETPAQTIERQFTVLVQNR